MKNLARHIWLIVGITAGVVLVGTVYLTYNHRGGAMANPVGGPYDPVTRWERDRADELLNHLALDRDALVALNLSAQQAESILSTLRTWRSTHEATLAARKNDIDNAVHALRQIRKAIAVGPADPQHDQTLSQALQDLTGARAAYDSALSTLRTDVDALLSAGQRNTWTAIGSGHGQIMPIRMLDLSDDQRVAIGKARQRYRWQHQAASNAQERTAALSGWEAAQASILTPGQQTVISAYHANYQSAALNVATAIETVLPPDQGAG